MDQDPEIEALPPELESKLRALGGVHAPAGLEARVSLGRLGGLRAPPELWHRVALSRLGQVEAPPELWSLVEPAVRDLTRRRGILPFRRLRRAALPAALAASLLVAAGVGYGLLRPRAERGEVTAKLTPEQRQRMRELARQTIVLEVRPEDMGSAGRLLGGAMGAPNGRTM